MITQEYLKKRLHYEPNTGVFVWISNSSTTDLIGKVAGCRTGTRGYTTIVIKGVSYLAHRLAFLYMTGSIPKYVDHKNQLRLDNRWSNLRPTTPSQNASNSKLPRSNTSGYRGVSWNANSKKWQSHVRINGKSTTIGLYLCKHHAFCEYVIASRRHFGEFSAV